MAVNNNISRTDFILDEQFNSSFWDIRENAIEQLAIYDSPALPEKIYNNITDKYGKILFCKFLNLTKNIYGAQYLIDFCFSEDTEVQDAALAALKKFKIAQIEPIIDKLINSENPYILKTILNIIGSNRLYKYTPEIIKKFKSANNELLTCILTNVIKLKDDRFSKPLLNILKKINPESDNKIICKTIEALINIDNKKYVKYFVELLKSNSPDVRQTSVWALSKSNKNFIIKHFILLFTKETNQYVKQEILKRIVNFKNYKVLNFLFNIYINDKKTVIRNMSVWQLELFDKKHRFKIYKKIYIKSNDNEIKHAAILMIGKLKYKPATKYLTKLLKYRDTNKLMSVIEALGYTENVELIPSLKKFVFCDNYLISYTSIVTICKLASENYFLDIISYLNIDEKKYDVIIQSILQYLLLIVDKIFLPKIIWDIVIKKIFSKNTNIRYSAIQLLGHSKNINSIVQLLQLLEIETDKEIKSQIKKCIYLLTKNKPDFIFELIEKYSSQKGVLYEILLDNEFTNINNIKILERLLLILQKSDKIDKSLLNLINIYSEYILDLGTLYNVYHKYLFLGEIESPDKINLYIKFFIKAVSGFNEYNKKIYFELQSLLKSENISNDVILQFLKNKTFQNRIDYMFYFYNNDSYVEIHNDIRELIKMEIAN